MQSIVLLASVLWAAGCAQRPTSVLLLPPSSRPAPPSELEAQIEQAEALARGGSLAEATRLLDEIQVQLFFRLAGSPDVEELRIRALLVDAGLDVADDLAVPEPPPAPPSPAVFWWSAEDLARPEVKAWRKRFLASDAYALRQWTRRAAPYYRDMVRTLERLDLPPELWVLPLLESGLNPRARSRSGAVGLWQFVSRTGRHYDLLITSDRDERRDWEAATQAAARYLTDLRRQLGDGLLALAGFNCGPYCVRRAMKEAGAAQFWTLDLPRETEDYVPKALALIDLLGAGDREPYRVNATQGLQYEWVRVPHPVLVSDLAQVCGVNTKELRRLNPSWKRQITPLDGHPVLARVPPGSPAAVERALTNGSLAEARDPRVHKVRRGETLWSISRNYDVKLSDLLLANSMTGREVIHPGDTIRLPGTVHRVQSGETLWGISRRYRVSLSVLLETNGLTGEEVIRPGLLLRIPG